MSNCERRAVRAGPRPVFRFVPVCLLAALSPARTPLQARELPPSSPRTATSVVRPDRESPEERLARGRQAFLHSDFSGTVYAIHDLLYPDIRLRSDEDVQSAHRLLALAHLYAHADDQAETEFTALLQLKPDFTLDAVSDPPAAIAFLDRLKKREREHIDEIGRRQREEAERAAREDERRKRDEDEKRRIEDEDRIRRSMKPVILEQRPFMMNLVPFGTGQFQNGQRRKGYAFLGTQAVLGLTSASVWLAIQIKYDFGKRKVLPVDYPLATYMSGTAIVSGALFWGDVAWGIIDAVVTWSRAPQKVIRPASLGLTLAPFSLSGGGGGFAIGGVF